MTFLLAVAAVKRQAGHISDGSYYRRLSWRESSSSRRPRPGTRRQIWLHYWMNLIGSVYRPGWKQYVTLEARLLALSALCVSPINLYAPPSPLPFLCSIKSHYSNESNRRHSWRRFGTWSAAKLRCGDTPLFSCWEIRRNLADMQVCLSSVRVQFHFGFNYPGVNREGERRL